MCIYLTLGLLKMEFITNGNQWEKIYAVIQTHVSVRILPRFVASVIGGYPL